MTNKIVTNDNQPSSTQMDSYTNMVVVDSNITVINQTGKCADVRTLSEDLSRMESVPTGVSLLSKDVHIACEERIVCAFYATQLDTSIPHDGGGG